MNGPLHIVNATPYASGALESCLAHLSEGAALLLIEDGVYAALADGNFAERLAEGIRGHALYALAPDLAARGLATRRLIDGLRVIDYPDFVQLAAEHSTAQSWF
ncbi:sulfurtransferase complex subunit TusB [Telmatospirillum siberiense]|uniref:Sulfurtransferase complex subunit TusB n=1 Tax=Telmatospirillum siberiense TaxID=382514 RepID=A0A2N3PPD2_9PROT|nr:sulfurtransferase complex subunit TusB [Telmatospirillum siberiense]PKU22247.1 sulfurtransferase complex subunit TusB [Telmatospirillum siberiense]